MIRGLTLERLFCIFDAFRVPSETCYVHKTTRVRLVSLLLSPSCARHAEEVRERKMAARILGPFFSTRFIEGLFDGLKRPQNLFEFYITVYVESVSTCSPCGNFVLRLFWHTSVT